jgi:hypothetical protein
MMSPSKTIKPSEAAYSQASIGLTIFNGDGLPGSPVDGWMEQSPYTVPIDVVIDANGEYLSYDNRRLYSARNYARVDWKITVNEHEFTEQISEQRIATHAADVIFRWQSNDEFVSGSGDVHEVEAKLMYWGLITSYRCASQNPEFNINGTHTTPTVMEYSVAYRPQYKLCKAPAGTKDIVRMTEEEGLSNLISVLDDDELLVCSTCKNGRIFARKDFNEIIRQNSQGIVVESYRILKNRFLQLKAQGDNRDDDWSDQDAFQRDLQRSNMIDALWMECDINQVSS